MLSSNMSGETIQLSGARALFVNGFNAAQNAPELRPNLGDESTSTITHHRDTDGTQKS